MRAGTEQLRKVLTDSQTAYLLVDVLHGTDRVAQGVSPVDWSLSGNLASNVKSTGRVRFVHESLRGESWVPDGTRGILSPFRATLLLTYVVKVGGFEERVQLGLFDVVDVPFAEDAVSHTNARWVAEEVAGPDTLLPSPFLPPAVDLFLGGMVYKSGTVQGGVQRVVTSTVEVEIASLENRVLEDSLVSPATVSGSAVDVWRQYGLLPVETSQDVTLAKTTIPADEGSRLKLVQSCAEAMGGVPVVNSRGNWALAGEDQQTLVLQAWGDQSTVTEITHQVSTVGFSNVVRGVFEAVDGRPIYSTWVAPGDLSPEALGRRWVSYVKSDTVRNQFEADEFTAAVGRERTGQDVDVPVVCLTNPLLEVGDAVRVEGWVRPLEGYAQRVDMGSGATMTLTIRARRQL